MKAVVIALLLTPAVAVCRVGGPQDVLPMNSEHNQVVCKRITKHALSNPCRLPVLSVIRGAG